MAGRMIETTVKEEDIKIEGSLRPQTLDDYIGQRKVKDNLKVYIEAAKQRQDALDHVLTTSFLFSAFIASILFINSGATKGTFLLDLDISFISSS